MFACGRLHSRQRIDNVGTFSTERRTEHASECSLTPWPWPVGSFTPPWTTRRSPSEAVKAAARACQFTLVGPGAGRAARSGAARVVARRRVRRRHGLDGAAARRAARPDRGAAGRAHGHRARHPLPPARRRGGRRAVARYARGRDYHYAHRDRMKALRKRLLALDPTLETYAAVDTGVAMEKVWAERAGLGLDRQERLPHQPEARVVAHAVGDVHRSRGRRLRPPARPPLRRLHALPRRLPDGRLRRAGRGRRAPVHRLPVDREPRRGPAERCAPPSASASSGATSARRSAPGTTASCRRATPRFSPRPLAALTPAEIAALTPDDFERLAAGMAVARAQYDGLRRNALYAIGAARDRATRRAHRRRAPRRRSGARRSPTPPAGRATAGARVTTADDAGALDSVGVASYAGPPPRPCGTGARVRYDRLGSMPKRRDDKRGNETATSGRSPAPSSTARPTPRRRSSGRLSTRCCCTTTTTRRRSSSSTS